MRTKTAIAKRFTRNLDTSDFSPIEVRWVTICSLQLRKIKTNVGLANSESAACRLVLSTSQDPVSEKLKQVLCALGQIVAGLALEFLENVWNPPESVH